MNVIVTMIRDEQDLIADFVVHHLDLGFDRIIIFDDQSSEKVSSSLSGLDSNLLDKVDIHDIDFDFYGAEPPPSALYDPDLYRIMKGSKQIYFLNLALKKMVASTDWVAFIDADEFIWDADLDIHSLRKRIEEKQYCGVILDWLNYGHGFHLRPPMPNNMAAYIWRASSVYGEGKYYGSAGALAVVSSPHYPSARDHRYFCDAFLEPRPALFSARRWTASDVLLAPHLKHYMVRDLDSFFRKKFRGRIATSDQFDSASPYWKDRVLQIGASNEVPDPAFARQIIRTRIKHRLPVDAHEHALANAEKNIDKIRHSASVLDLTLLRTKFPQYENQESSSIIYNLLRDGLFDARDLEFASLPTDFEADVYRKRYGDLANLNDQQLRNHYVRYGIAENRDYK